MWCSLSHDLAAELDNIKMNLKKYMSRCELD
jgi:hypothetical protein